jgi:hypothetical protein
MRIGLGPKEVRNIIFSLLGHTKWDLGVVLKRMLPKGLLYPGQERDVSDWFEEVAMHHDIIFFLFA